MENLNIENVKQIIQNNFPKLWIPTEACLATIATLLLKNNANPTALVLVGQASTGKTTVLFLFKNLDDITYHSDYFTPKAFSSHYAKKSKKELKKIDMLPRIKNKCLVVPDLGVIFGKRKEDLSENLSILTRVLDGDGLSTDSGTEGQKALTGECMLSMCCATTPLPPKVWEIMNRFGARLLFLHMNDIEQNKNNLIKDFTDEKPYKLRRNNCQEVIHNFLKQLWHSSGGVGSIIWDDRDIPLEVIDMVANLANLLARLRGFIPIRWIDGNYEHQSPLIEDSHRPMALLLNIARGRAILYNRKQIGLEDLPLIIDITLSSCPEDRGKIIRALIKQRSNALTTKEVCGLLKVKEKTALKSMEQLEILGLVTVTTEETIEIGRPEKTIQINKDFEWLREPSFTKLFSKIDDDIFRK